MENEFKIKIPESVSGRLVTVGDPLISKQAI